ncbi:MAG TPA: hypothetical protein DHW82_09415 [Spirochaetia bacterium]|nr:MAG: hypothetical protein A2Y41_03160 [Spirochaetes bacterium GWB1_36_13]HCL57209.1 hypothetical protein [Spirochaetia bacterium]
MKNPILLRDINQQLDDIRIDRHGIIEASAGTGKTYAVTKIVRKILVETATDLNSILLVTFTEKAAGELKEKIRAEINLCLKDYPEKRDKFQKSLKEFDDAPIYTIHGFCHSILQEYSSESFEVIQDEKNIQKKLLYQMMRKEWETLYGQDFDFLLSVSGFPEYDGRTKNSRTLKKILDGSTTFQHLAEDILRPEPEDISLLIQEILKGLRKIQESLQGVSFPETSKTKIKEEFFQKIRLFLSAQNEKEIFLSSVDLSELFQKKEKTADYITEADLSEFLRFMNDNDQKIKSIKNYLISDSIQRLRERMKNFKKKYRLLSYQDMLSHVFEMIQSGFITQAVREKFSFAVIDEFQDTDFIQWQIFKKLFTQGQKQKLFVVGDPKQAIYSFRGADIYVYQEAKKYLQENSALVYELIVNRRTIKPLIQKLNTLFSYREKDQKDWFDTEGIVYQEVEALENKKTDHECFQIIHLGDGIHSGKAKNRLADGIACEIEFLLEKREKTEKNNLICILVSKRKEALPIEKSLRKKGIAYSFYKKPGIFESDEAVSLYYLLKSTAMPSDKKLFLKCLLSPVFDFKKEDFEKLPFLSSSHPLRIFFQSLQNFSRDEKWGMFFDEILRQVKIKISTASQMLNKERILTNYEQLSEILIREAESKNLDIYALSDFLQNRIQNQEGKEDIHRIETDSPAVQIMTVHASKGLEFPIVFLAGGFGESPERDLYVYHQDKHRIIDLCPDAEGEKKALRELREEEKRLYYVALTRAKERLYLPYFRQEKTGKGEYSKKAKGFVIETLVPLIEEKDMKIFSKDWKMYLRDKEKEKTEEKETPFCERYFDFFFQEYRQKKILETSFSSLHIHKKIEPENDEFDTGILVSQEDFLPRGKETGLCFHEILECYDFTNPLKEAVIEKIKKYHLEEHEEQVFTILKQLSKTEIMPGFSFDKLNPSLLLREKEFFYSFPAGIKTYLNGFIDLIFFWEGKYYLADWKTNYLESYEGEPFYHLVVSEYELQYEIYVFALDLWLSGNIKNYDFKKNFGGVLYLYLRGISPETQKGIYFLPAEKIELETIREKMKQIIEAQHESISIL